MLVLFFIGHKNVLQTRGVRKLAPAPGMRAQRDGVEHRMETA